MNAQLYTGDSIFGCSQTTTDSPVTTESTSTSGTSGTSASAAETSYSATSPDTTVSTAPSTGGTYASDGGTEGTYASTGAYDSGTTEKPVNATSETAATTMDGTTVTPPMKSGGGSSGGSGGSGGGSSGGKGGGGDLGGGLAGAASKALNDLLNPKKSGPAAQPLKTPSGNRVSAAPVSGNRAVQNRITARANQVSAKLNVNTLLAGAGALTLLYFLVQ